MTRTRTWRTVVACLAALPLTISLAACGGGTNGGATTCGQYKKASDSGKKSAVTKMLEEHGDSTSNGSVTLTRASVRAYCETIGSDSDRIDSVYG